MIDSKKKNNLCFWQAQAFIDYVSKLKIRSKGDLLETLNHWRDSKQFLEKDAKHIEKLVLEYWEKKGKQMAELKHKKHRPKNRVVLEDKRQLHFDFAGKRRDENAEPADRNKREKNLHPQELHEESL